jgi:hypothetical protein
MLQNPLPGIIIYTQVCNAGAMIHPGGQQLLKSAANAGYTINI